jgi:carbonic anhydrase
MVDFKRPLKMNLTERRHSVHSLIAPSVNESFDGGTTAQGRVSDWRAGEKHSSFHQPAVFLVGCSDYSANEIESIAPLVIIFHDNIANLVHATDINCLMAIQYAVEVCRVQSIVVRGHHGCRGVGAAIENRGLDILSNWLRPVARLAAKYESLLEQITEASDRRDALCELNVI